MLLGKKRQILIIPGVNPIEDSTALDTIFFTDGDKIRFQSGKLRKQQGVQRVFNQNYLPILGTARNIYSYNDEYGNPISIIGTNTRLYAYLPENGPIFYNITPLQTDMNAIPNSLTTAYENGTYTISTTAGSPIVDLYFDQYLINGEFITIEGVTGGPYGGIPASNFNGTFQATVLNNTHIQIMVVTSATITENYEVTFTWASDYLIVNYSANGSIDGDRVKITGSTSVDGISDTAINDEFIISNIIDDNNFTIQTGTIATSYVTAGGGTGIMIQLQIAPGNVDVDTTAGYGVGHYGNGYYGVGENTSEANQANITYPRIWSMAVIGSNLILTPGDPLTNSTDNLYLWQNNVDVAPTLLSTYVGADNVPLACKWVYVSLNVAVVLGSEGILNNFTSSDEVNTANPYPINWLVGPSTIAYSDEFSEASALISQAKSRNFDLIFTKNSVYLVEFVDKPDIWFPRKLFGTDGIIGPKARGIVEDSVFWMGQGDFYVFDGYSVNALPNNTLKRHVYDNLNVEQAYKSFVYVNVEWSEITFFYPAKNENEPNSNVTYNYKEFHWTPSKWNRSAAEEYTNVGQYPLLIQSNAIISHSISNGISTYFFDLDADPIGTTDGSNLVTVNLATDVYLQAGDQIFITGSSSVGGLTADQINGVQTLIYGNTGEETITFQASGNATSTTLGGGTGITVGTQILGVNYTGNDVAVDEIVTISGADAVDGFSEGQVNVTGPVRYVNGDFLEIDAASGFSTSAVTDGGGPSAVILLSEGCLLFEHENKLNDYNINFNLSTDPWSTQYAPLNAFAQTNYSQLDDGDNTMVLHSFYSDIRQSGNMQVTVNFKEYAQSNHVNVCNFVLGPEMPKIDVQMIGRERQYIFRSNVLDGNFLMGKIYEEIKPSTPR